VFRISFKRRGGEKHFENEVGDTKVIDKQQEREKEFVGSAAH